MTFITGHTHFIIIIHPCSEKSDVEDKFRIKIPQSVVSRVLFERVVSGRYFPSVPLLVSANK